MEIDYCGKTKLIVRISPPPVPVIWDRAVKNAKLLVQEKGIEKNSDERKHHRGNTASNFLIKKLMFSYFKKNCEILSICGFFCSKKKRKAPAKKMASQNSPAKKKLMPNRALGFLAAPKQYAHMKNKWLVQALVGLLSAYFTAEGNKQKSWVFLTGYEVSRRMI